MNGGQIIEIIVQAQSEHHKVLDERWSEYRDRSIQVESASLGIVMNGGQSIKIVVQTYREHAPVHALHTLDKIKQVLI